jgi:hypothetical protein
MRVSRIVSGGRRTSWGFTALTTATRCVFELRLNALTSYFVQRGEADAGQGGERWPVPDAGHCPP